MSEVKLKSAKELELMRESGRLLASVFAYLDGQVKTGMSTMDINDLVERYIVDELDARPASKGQYGFPYSLNTSLNQVVCHGVPADDQTLQEGDIINVDVTPKLRGYHGDSSRMFSIGPITPEDQSLIDVTKECLRLGIEAVTPGDSIAVIGCAIEPYAREHGFSVVRAYTGHGIGKKFHQAPSIPHMAIRAAEGTTLPTLEPGMAFTIEPMLNAGGMEVLLEEDGWTVSTADDSRSAQWEHTLLVTNEGIEVLTDGS